MDDTWNLLMANRDIFMGALCVVGTCYIVREMLRLLLLLFYPVLILALSLVLIPQWREMLINTYIPYFFDSLTSFVSEAIRAATRK